MHLTDEDTYPNSYTCLHTNVAYETETTFDLLHWMVSRLVLEVSRIPSLAQISVAIILVNGSYSFIKNG